MSKKVTFVSYSASQNTTWRQNGFTYRKKESVLFWPGNFSTECSKTARKLCREMAEILSCIWCILRSDARTDLDESCSGVSRHGQNGK